MAQPRRLTKKEQAAAERERVAAALDQALERKAGPRRQKEVCRIAVEYAALTCSSVAPALRFCRARTRLTARMTPAKLVRKVTLHLLQAAPAAAPAATVAARLAF